MTKKGISYNIPNITERYKKTKTIKITNWANTHKKHITRNGTHDEKSRFGKSKKGVPYYVYFDLDVWGYRTATTTWKVRH